jgi:hypothetical protein
VVTHQSWRGQFARGTYGNGPRAGQLSDCDPAIGYPGQDCVPVQWPGFNTSAWHEGAAKPGAVGDDMYWMGTLAVGMTPECWCSDAAWKQPQFDRRRWASTIGPTINVLKAVIFSPTEHTAWP